MRNMSLALASAALLAACSPAEKNKDAIWELTGLATPESALPDTAAGIIYVSNVAGEPTVKDGKGSISKVSLDGKLIAKDWVTGLDAPKGLAMANGHLFVSDIDRLVEIDPADGKIVNRYEAKDAKFLNDVAADAVGRVYVSDMATNTIWRLSAGTFEPWLTSPALKNPNGLKVQGDKLIVAAWGPMEGDGPLGNLIEVGLNDKAIRDLGDGKPVGNLDGLEPLGPSTWLVTDWMAGKLFRIDTSGKVETLMELAPGSADLGYDPATRTAYIPMMKDDKLIAVKIPE